MTRTTFPFLFFFHCTFSPHLLVEKQKFINIVFVSHYVSSLIDHSSTGAIMGIRNKVWFFFPLITSLPNFDPNFISTIFKVTVIISFIGFKLISNLDQYVPKQMLSLDIDDFCQETEMEIFYSVTKQHKSHWYDFYWLPCKICPFANLLYLSEQLVARGRMLLALDANHVWYGRSEIWSMLERSDHLILVMSTLSPFCFLKLTLCPCSYFPMPPDIKLRILGWFQNESWEFSRSYMLFFGS